MTTATETTKETAAATEAASTPFAVIETGGKQYMVHEGDVIDVELLSATAEGDTVTFDHVLVKDDGTQTTVGTPYISGAKVTAVNEGTHKGKKLSIIRFEAKSNRSRKVGHRQPYTRVRITSIGA